MTQGNDVQVPKMCKNHKIGTFMSRADTKTNPVTRKRGGICYS